MYHYSIYLIGHHNGDKVGKICAQTGKNVREVEDKLMRVVPKEFLLNAHHWLILHGRYTCKAQKPLCQSCIINDLCEYGAKTTFQAA